MLENKRDLARNSVASHLCNTPACVVCATEETKGKDISRFHCLVFGIRHKDANLISVCDHEPVCRDVNEKTFIHFG